MGIESQAPKGICPQCGTPKMFRIEGGVTIWFCPKHGTASEAPSHRINIAKDPGVEGFKKVVNTRGFEELIPTAGDVRGLVAAEETNKDLTKERQLEKIEFSAVGLLKIPLALLDLKPDEDVEVILTRDQLSRVYAGLEIMQPPKDMKEARVLFKLMEKIEQLLEG